jgi:hypothetical protein
MSDTTAVTTDGAPWHLWAVAILSLLWDGSGAITIWMAQAGALEGMSADEIAYYANQATWFMLVTDVALVAPIVAAIALMFRNKAAVWLFGMSVAAVLITNTYDLLAGSSRALANTGALVVTCLVVVLAILQLVYARAQKKRGVLR